MVSCREMSRKEEICRALILGARILAAPIAYPVAIAILGSVRFNWTSETPAIAFFVGYAAFVFIPILHLRSKPFVILSVLGGILAVGSLVVTVGVFAALGELYENPLVSQVILLLILMFFYSYLPVTLLLRNIRNSAQPGTTPEERNH